MIYIPTDPTPERIAQAMLEASQDLAGLHETLQSSLYRDHDSIEWLRMLALCAEAQANMNDAARVMLNSTLQAEDKRGERIVQ